MDGFRFRWKRRHGWGVEAYDAFEGDFRIAQIIHDPGANANVPNPYRWMVSCLYMGGGRTEPKGAAASPRAAAIGAEAAFETSLPTARGFHMRTEKAIALCEHLGIDLPPQTRWQAEKSGLIPAAARSEPHAEIPPVSASRDSSGNCSRR